MDKRLLMMATVLAAVLLLSGCVTTGEFYGSGYFGDGYYSGSFYDRNHYWEYPGYYYYHPEYDHYYYNWGRDRGRYEEPEHKNGNRGFNYYLRKHREKSESEQGRGYRRRSPRQDRRHMMMDG